MLSRRRVEIHEPRQERVQRLGEIGEARGELADDAALVIRVHEDRPRGAELCDETVRGAAHGRRACDVEEFPMLEAPGSVLDVARPLER